MSTLDKRFRQLQLQAGINNVWPVVDCRWGYAAFVAYIIKVERKGLSTRWWVVEMDEEQHVSKIKPLCNYD